MHYFESVNFFFTTNDVSNENKQLFFLSAIGSKHYAILRCLIDNRQEEKTFEQSCMLMERHNKLALNTINEYFLLNTKDKKDGQSITEYGTTVKKKFEHSNFGDKVTEYIQDQIVVGVKHEKIYEQLLSERKLSLEKNLEIAVFMESYKVFKRDSGYSRNIYK